MCQFLTRPRKVVHLESFFSGEAQPGKRMIFDLAVKKKDFVWFMFLPTLIDN